MAIKKILLVIAIGLAMMMSVTGAWADDPKGSEDGIGDIDPARPVFFNVRQEFHQLEGDAWTDALILRTDIIKLGGLRNGILRFDVPLVAVELPKGRDYGLGDLYGQLLLIPYRKDNFSIALGSGLTAPCASGDTLGKGKWQAAPLAIPIWRFQDPRALFFVKLQDSVSFAGQQDRADIHYLTATPFLAIKINERWWAGVDTEAKIDWERNHQQSYKSGVVVLRMWTKKFGVWVKPEILWGPHREGDFSIRVSFFWNHG